MFITFTEISAVMNLFSKRNLRYSDYKWTNYVPPDPRVAGKPDDTYFNKEEGNEVVYLINRLMTIWDYRFSNTGNKMEKLIRDKLPKTITKQEEVQQWLKANLTF